MMRMPFNAFLSTWRRWIDFLWNVLFIDVSFSQLWLEYKKNIHQKENSRLRRTHIYCVTQNFMIVIFMTYCLLTWINAQKRRMLTTADASCCVAKEIEICSVTTHLTNVYAQEKIHYLESFNRTCKIAHFPPIFAHFLEVTYWHQLKFRFF